MKISPIPRLHSPGKPTVLASLLACLCSVGAPALAASDLVISQVYGGGGNNGSVFSNDFIELFNRGAEPIALGGKSVQYASAKGTSWSATALPNKTLQPGQFFLIQQAPGADTSKPLPAADASGTLTMSGTNGKVLLSSGTAPLSGANPVDGVLDKVAYGDATNPFEGAPAAVLTNGTGARRIDACVDSDRNSVDFSTGTPAPRNSASPATPCGPVAAPIVTNCPASLSVDEGQGGSVQLSATDADSIVTGAAISAGQAAGISLAGFTPANGTGGTASVFLQAANNLPSSIFRLTVSFSNNAQQTATCNVMLSVAGNRSIPQIQGAGPTSPFAETIQYTEGVVTNKVSNGYFLQDPNGDGDPATSDGVFVFTSTEPTVNIGDRLRIKGYITEYKPGSAARSYTEFKDLSLQQVLASGHSVIPTNIAFDGKLDHLEGMLVSFTNELTVNQTSYLGERGELTLAVGRREIPTNRHRPGTPEAQALAAANAVNVITLDDNLFSAPDPVPYLGADGTVRAGDVVGNLTGTIDYGALGSGGTGFKLQPTVAPVFSRTNARSAAPQLAPGNVRVASANVLNFFTAFTDASDAWGATSPGCKVGSTTRPGNCRGADNIEEFQRQRDKIVASLKAVDADVVGLMEIQNNDDIAVGYLVDALNAAYGKAEYAVVPKPAATGTDAIRVAMIYKPAALALVGGALSDGDAVNNRAPMAQTFKANNGARFSLIVNHLKSKGSCGGGLDADQGDGQSCNNAARVKQAERLANYLIPQVLAASGDPDVLVIGDLNAYAFEDPIALLTGPAKLVNQLERFVRPHGTPYSYIYGGESGYLDHALASPSLSTQVVDATEWHNNADEPAVIDYDMNDKNASARALWQPHAYRAADHDPVVLSLNLTPTFADATGSFAIQRSGLVLNRVTGKYSGTITLTNTGAAAVNGPVQLRFSGLPAGVTLDGASGSHQGAPYLSVSAGALAPGAKLVVPVVFSNPARAVIGYTSSVFSGTF